MYLECGQYWSSPTVLEEDDEIEVTVEVEQGGPSDVLLFDSGRYVKFGQFTEDGGTTSEYSVVGWALNVMTKSYRFQTPSSDCYNVITSNAGRIEQGARPQGNITAYLKVVATRPAQLRGLSSYLFIQVLPSSHH